MIPHLFSSSIIPKQNRSHCSNFVCDGLPLWFSREDYKMVYQHFSALTSGKDLRSIMESIWLWDESSKIGYAHATETYMSFLLALSNDASIADHFSGGPSHGTMGGGAWCPVDLDIYVETDKGPKLVGRIKDNVSVKSRHIFTKSLERAENNLGKS